MCNRYSLTKKQERIITREYGSLELYFMERFNIAPTQNASVILIEDKKLAIREMQWGLAVRWTKAPLLNVQLESIEKPALKENFDSRRCLVPASSFYEWTDYHGRRQPIRFQFNDERLFCFAGLYSGGATEENFTILTVPANEFLRKVHNRMPFIVPKDDYDTWLDPKSDSFRRVAPSSEPLKSCWINPAINNARNDDAESARPLLATAKRSSHGPSLPNGLPAGATVKVLASDGDSFEIEFEGKAFKLPWSAVTLEGAEEMLL
ncbi:MAG TPA: SOS response-associated peptidase [Verrucomicrobiae bacterium]|jgi:putative SOS response-associated peptidase YedK